MLYQMFKVFFVLFIFISENKTFFKVSIFKLRVDFKNVRDFIFLFAFNKEGAEV